MLSTRQKKLLTKLIGAHQYMTVDFLAKWLDVSQKTVRNDLETLASVLEEMGCSLIRTPGKGVLLYADSDVREELMDSLELATSLVDKNVQLTMVSLYVLMTENVTIQKIADEFYLSRSSVHQILLEVEELFDPYNLQLTKEVRKGLFIHGTERSKRKAVFYWLLSKWVDLNTICSWLPMDINEQQTIATWISSCEEERGVLYSEDSKRHLSLFLVWWKNRVSVGTSVFIPKKHRIHNPIIGTIDNYLNQLSNEPELMDNEKNFVHQIFDQLKVVTYEFEADDLDHYKREHAFTLYLIQEISKILEVNLASDKKLMNDLMYHAKSAFLRMEQGAEIDNPYTEEIKIRYRAIYEMVHQITTDMGYKMVAAEVAYITMHISSAFERSGNKKYLPNVIVVCTTGLATSSILTTKLEHIEPGFHLVRVVSSQEVDEELCLDNIDFVLTTSKLSIDFASDTKIYRVSPLLLDEEKAKIQHEAHKVVNRKQLQRFNEVYQHATSIVPTLFDEQVHISKTNNWHDAISIAATPLLEAGYIKQGYIQEMIMSVERNGTYMVFLPKIAFVHASPENVIKEGISMTVFENDMIFGSKNPEEVKIIIVLAIKESHNQDFLQLYRYLENQAVFEKLIDSNNQEWRK
ncbi:PTS sugar transporter subunit IIA [Oceanobacillus sp. ISL-73]|nr:MULTISPECIES: PTS sugar transporter subunit IIA [unclassified Oceanobacillus]MBT2599971.1 PTS sugar transporter subunit IIA [Oceanobacillus sp. ISL-74]MBT2652580.1 PTS sugar transporter subunit IIA [Oceanobacillus sp. ISL-73]